MEQSERKALGGAVPVATLGQGGSCRPSRGRKESPRDPVATSSEARDGKPVQLALLDGLGPVMPAKLTAHPLYDVWAAMVARCFNPKNRQFSDYGLRGIYVCDEWRNSSRTFIAWALSNGWQRGLQLDRRDNDGPYSPGNCRFVTRLVNANNKRNNVRLSDGMALSDSIRASGLNKSMVYDRLQRGISPDDAVSIPRVDPHKLFLSDGTPLADAIRASGLSQSTVYTRVQRGISPDDAVSIPLVDGHKRFLSDGTPLADAIRASGLNKSMVYDRLQRGISPDDAVSIPRVDPHKLFLSDGTPLADAIRASGLPQGTVYSRLRLGWSPDEAAGVVPRQAKRPNLTGRQGVAQRNPSGSAPTKQRKRAGSTNQQQGDMT